MVSNGSAHSLFLFCSVRKCDFAQFLGLSRPRILPDLLGGALNHCGAWTNGAALVNCRQRNARFVAQRYPFAHASRRPHRLYGKRPGCSGTAGHHAGVSGRICSEANSQPFKQMKPETALQPCALHPPQPV
ncbi:hypothetical protein GGQ68_000998 [Sagittula marina]|uniref:Uncharacterized protein n=1 Tax=Sagittula marina TaxID=943940 RepID=A0A7W6DKY4_9RHOB|nr:hypothetical protein [Sagittula marina]